jgi:hypothetical protein
VRSSTLLQPALKFTAVQSHVAIRRLLHARSVHFVVAVAEVALVNVFETILVTALELRECDEEHCSEAAV